MNIKKDEFMTIESINPATGHSIQTYESHTDQDIEAALSRSIRAHQALKQLSFADRAKYMHRVAEILEQDVEKFAKILTQEMGKPISAAKAEVKKCADVCRYYADHTEGFLEECEITTDAKRSYISYEPLGPILAVMPWNFPFWQVFRFAAPALMAGNTCVLKHASNVPGSALAIADIFKRAGFMDGAFETLLIGSDKVEGILKDPRIKAATLTGSEKAGASVAAIAGSQIKKTVLELGGSDPFIIMPSADLEAAVKAAVTGRTMNNGQSCIAAKRFIIHSDIYEDVKARLKVAFEELKIGDPMEEDTDIGPLAMPQIRDDLDEQVQKSVSMGAVRVTGAEVMAGDGYFYRPGLLENIPEYSPAANEEFFGPVASLFKVQNLEEAIARGNKTRFGLGAAIFTQNEDETKIAVRELRAGGVFVNQIVASNPRLPFGGVGISGYGRELSDIGMKEFMNIKTVSIK